MTKIQCSRNQYTVTISPEHIKRMGWDKGTEVYIAKDPDRNLLYIEEVPRKGDGTTKSKIRQRRGS